MREVVILEGARTAWAEYCGTPGFGAFKDLSCVELGAHAARAAMRKSQVQPEEIGHVVFGNAMQSSADALYGARHVGLRAGVPVHVPAVTVNRICGSGLEAVVMGARLLTLGEAEFVLAGGMESMSQAPHVLRGLRGEVRFRFGQDLKLEDWLFQNLRDPFCGLYMAETSDRCARKWGIGRDAQDAFAYRSHQEAARAIRDGLFREEIVPVPVPQPRGEPRIVELDDHVKPETTIEKLSKLPPSFGKDGFVTAGNASGIVDGAASVVLTTEARAKDRGLRPIGRLVAHGVAGVAPEFMGMGPAPAIREALKRAALKLEKIDLFEVNEAFAGQVLAVEKELGIPRDRLNVNGGSIALGHPLGATGTRLLLTLLYELRRRKRKLGVASACIGGGQGIAVVLEAL